MSEEEIVALNDVLLENKAVELHLVNAFADSFTPKPIPTRLTSLFKPSFKNGKTFQEI